jgi:hypothetical protein
MKEFLRDVFFYLLGVALEGPKGKGWKGQLFVLPFLIAVGIVLFLILRTFIVWL